MRYLKMGLLSVLMMVSFSLYADLQAKLNAVFEKYNSGIHVDNADIYVGQKAGYFNGPGITVRNRLTAVELMGIDWPTWGGGCGGIDLHLGGFSFVTGDQIIDSLKSVASASSGYAFMLAMDAVSPQIQKVMAQMQSWVNDYGRWGIDSCQLAEEAIGSIAGKRTRSNQFLCNLAANKQGRFADWLAGRRACADDNQRDQVAAQRADDPSVQDVMGEEFNLAWKVIQKIPSFAKDKELAQLIMSLTGTFISSQKSSPSLQRFQSKIDDESFIAALLRGGTLQCYQCAESRDVDCLSLKEAQIKLQFEKSWSGRVGQALLNMQMAIRNDEEISAKDQRLLGQSSLPLYKIINIMTAYKKGRCPIQIYRVADIIGTDLLIQYVSEVVGKVREAALQVKNAQVSSLDIDGYLQDLDRVENKIYRMEARTFHLMDQELALIQQVEQMEEKMAAALRIY